MGLLGEVRMFGTPPYKRTDVGRAKEAAGAGDDGQEAHRRVDPCKTGECASLRKQSMLIKPSLKPPLARRMRVVAHH